ncbi:hypothetical protein PV518_39390 [Streptomyces sp. ND04-05B]|uniref:hypothetical protein n=1 Tax=Streptomyces sp. ND04-05B TaxID=3028693 RepID=UPI0029AC7559|nr:hypothetical protein [Streptomyces sp. ND04-05B]MDX3068160.1 hypothetical protein [Streptomyces sp. ND04-05B]
MNVLGHRDQVAAEEDGASPVCQPGESAGNDEEAGYQPASPSRAIRTYTPVKERSTLMANSATTATTPSTPTIPNRDRLIAVLPEVADASMREALPHLYTPELAAEFAATMIGLLTGTICPVYPTVCTDTEPGHYDHFNHEHGVTTKDGDKLLDVGFVANSGGSGPLVYIAGMGSEDLPPAEVRAKTAEIRQLLDQADVMADKAIAMEAHHAKTERVEAAA